MSFLLKVAGLILALFCWFNPLAIDELLRISLFILGFDMMDMVPKILIFASSIAFPVFGEALGAFSWILLFMFMSELIMMILEIERSYKLFVKPAAVFTAAFLSVGLQPALVIAGIDLLINLTDKIRTPKKKSK